MYFNNKQGENFNYRALSYDSITYMSNIGRNIIYQHEPNRILPYDIMKNDENISNRIILISTKVLFVRNIKRRKYIELLIRKKRRDKLFIQNCNINLFQDKY